MRTVEVKDNKGKGIAIADGLLHQQLVTGCEVTADDRGALHLFFYGTEGDDILKVVVMSDVPFIVKQNMFRSMSRHIRDGNKANLDDKLQEEIRQHLREQEA